MARRELMIDRLDAAGRTRALTDDEVCRLESAIKRQGRRNEQWLWTKGDDRRLSRYLARGKKPKQIAILMKRTERAVWQRMVRLKLRVRDHAATVQSRDDAESGK